jgi:hypothetical protein
MVPLGNHEEVRTMVSKDRRTITVGVYGGVVQWIQGIPEDVRAVVHDFDIEGIDTERLPRDERGQDCVESIWEASEVDNG